MADDQKADTTDKIMNCESETRSPQVKSNSKEESLAGEPESTNSNCTHMETRSSKATDLTNATSSDEESKCMEVFRADIETHERQEKNTPGMESMKVAAEAVDVDSAFNAEPTANCATTTPDAMDISHSSGEGWQTLNEEHFTQQPVDMGALNSEKLLQSNFWYQNQATAQLSSQQMLYLPANLMVNQGQHTSHFFPGTQAVLTDFTSIQMPFPVQACQQPPHYVLPAEGTYGGPVPFGNPQPVEAATSRSSRRRKSGKARVHRWSHSDIMQLIWCWCEASLEPKVDSQGGRGQKWKLIHSRFNPLHPWSTETSIRAYFKTKIKDKYNCRVVYDKISKTLTLPDINDLTIYQRL